MKSFSARWNNALAVVVLACFLTVFFASSVSQAAIAPPAAIGASSPAGIFTSPAAVAIGSVAANAMVANEVCVGFPFPPYIPCVDPLSRTAGMCVSTTVCMALTTVAINAGIIGVGLGVVSKIFSGDTSGVRSGASASGASASGASSAGTRQCTSYYQVTVRTSDPCAIYVPPTSSSQLNNSSQLLNSLNTPSQSNPLLVQANNNAISNPLVSTNPLVTANTNILGTTNQAAQLLNSIGSQSIGNLLLGQANNVGALVTIPSTQTQSSQSQAASPRSEAKGDIQMTFSGVTIQAGVRDIARNTEHAGFFGSNASLNAQPQGFLERMCLVRPWENPQVSYGIPTPLFDNQCASRELRVGIFPEVQSVATTSEETTASTTPEASPAETQPAQPEESAEPAGPYVPPAVYIRASPASVSLGSRATIRWASQGVTSCTETSPDGSFNSNTLRGEASTVPISSATVFSISCIAPDGSHVTDSVTVNLAI